MSELVSPGWRRAAVAGNVVLGVAEALAATVSGAIGYYTFRPTVRNLTAAHHEHH